MHTEPSPLAGHYVTVTVDGKEYLYHVEDWWDHLAGESWMYAEGNPAALKYAMRAGLAGLPVDDEVLYGKIGGLGHLVHISEITVPGDDS